MGQEEAGWRWGFGGRAGVGVGPGPESGWSCTPGTLESWHLWSEKPVLASPECLSCVQIVHLKRERKHGNGHPVQESEGSGS